MKPSEFWAQIFALPEQARQAEGEAGELRVRADALTAWAKQVTSAHRDALFAADAEEMGRAVEILNSLPARPDAATVSSPTEEPAPLPEKTRKQRSDAGKQRARKGSAAPEEHRKAPHFAIYDSDPDPPEDDPGPPANPADVKAVDAARAMIAGDVRRAMNDYRNAPSSDPEPVTIGWLMVTLGLPEVVIRDALKLLSLVSWRMRREGDSQPVEVWGTWRQLREHIERSYADRANDDEIAQDLSIRIQDVKFALETR